MADTLYMLIWGYTPPREDKMEHPTEPELRGQGKVWQTLAETGSGAPVDPTPGHWYAVRFRPGPYWYGAADAVIVQTDGQALLANATVTATGSWNVVPWQSVVAGARGVAPPANWAAAIIDPPGHPWPVSPSPLDKRDQKGYTNK